jgi:hypothetical protein
MKKVILIVILISVVVLVFLVFFLFRNPKDKDLNENNTIVNGTGSENTINNPSSEKQDIADVQEEAASCDNDTARQLSDTYLNAASSGKFDDLKSICPNVNYAICKESSYNSLKQKIAGQTISFKRSWNEYKNQKTIKFEYDINNGKIRVVVYIRDTGSGCELYGRLVDG